MSEHRPDESARRETAARLWLSYYNRVLFEKGIISERERSRMDAKINSRRMTLT